MIAKLIEVGEGDVGIEPAGGAERVSISKETHERRSDLLPN